MKKVSVLMPVYNTREDHLREAIESILNQTFDDFEFLILNDCSPDANVERVVLSYHDDRIVYAKNEVNMGITPSRNKLIHMASGEYLAIMDHDDISLPTRLAKQVEFLDAHPDYGVISSKAQTIPKGRVSRFPTEDKDIKISLMSGCTLLHPASMVRKSVLLEHSLLYNEIFSPAEDYALWCSLIPYTKFHNIPEVLFLYREHETNTSKTQAKKMHEATLHIHALVELNNPVLYRQFSLKAKKTTRIRLFGFLPLLKIVRQGYSTKIFLFEKILLFSYKHVAKIQES